VRGRIWFATAAVVAGSLAVGVGMAGAAAAPQAQKLVCHVSLTTQPPPGSNTVTQPASQGSQYGRLNCGKPRFGHGVVGDSFTVPDSGDTVGKYTQYFNAGSVSGTFDLTPQQAGSPTDTNSFESQAWAGTIKITRGTGVYGLIKEKSAGEMKCTSVDSVHLSCVEKIKLTGV
jgi:hypothetical protein